MKEFNYIPAQKVRQANSRDMEEVKVDGQYYPTFNGCDHYAVDMSDLRVEDNDNWMNTITINLPNDNAVTICVMQTSNNQSCLDIQYHGDNIDNTRVMGMANGSAKTIEDMNLYAVIMDTK